MSSTPSTDWAGLSQRLQSVARALTGSTHDAEDLVQSTLAHVLARQPQQVEHFGYLRTTLVRQWLARRRSLSRRAAALARSALGLITTCERRDEAEHDERVADAVRAIEQLPPRQRAALVLRVTEELSYEAIAEVLECSVQAARANLHLARQRVRKCLEEPS